MNENITNDHLELENNEVHFPKQMLSLEDMERIIQLEKRKASLKENNRLFDMAKNPHRYRAYGKITLQAPLCYNEDAKTISVDIDQNILVAIIERNNKELQKIELGLAKYSYEKQGEE